VTSTFPDPQGTGALPVVVVVDERARHRTAVPVQDGPPAWLQLAATICAVAAGWFAIVAWRDPAAPLLMGVALLIAVAALGIDVTAAVRARRDTEDGAE
jgi:hypothetical protein